MKQSIITTGLNGLVGSRFAKDFNEQYQFKNLDLRDQTQAVDITNYDDVINAFSRASEAQFVLHLAAFTNVTAAWEQRDDKAGLAYQVNVVGTENIIKACEETNKHLIHVSTAYVFDGKKEEMYEETDIMNPIEWYGQTKAWAEERVMSSDIDWTILRIDQPFRSDHFEKVDFAHRIINGLKENKLYPLFDNHFFGPTYINDFAKIINFFIRTGNTGLFHASSGEMWTDYQFAMAISKILNLPSEIKKSDLNEYLKTVNRPYQKNTAMNCEKLKRILDFKIKSVEEAMAEVGV